MNYLEASFYFLDKQTKYQEGQIMDDGARAERKQCETPRKNNVTGNKGERLIGEKRPMLSSVGSHYSCNCFGSDCIHKQPITVEENRQINSVNNSKAKKTKIQQIKTH